MKKLLRALGLALVLAAMLATVAQGQGPPGSWTTDFTILNMDTQPGTVSITRYGECTPVGSCAADSGTLVESVSIGGSGSHYYNPALDSSFPSNWAGSIVVSSDRQIAATVTVANNYYGTDDYASDAYAGVSAVEDTVFLPIVMGDLGEWNTRMAIQNAGSQNTNVTIEYIGSGAPGNTTVNNLPPNMTAFVDQQENAGMSGFNGAALVSTNNGEPLAITVEEYKTGGGVLVMYVGIPLSQADTTLYMPGFIAQGTWATDFTIVNTSSSASAAIEINFSGSSQKLSGNLAANSSAYVNGYAGVYPSGWTGSVPTSSYYGAATISATGADCVVVYNISNSAGGPGNFAVGYVGAGAAQAAQTVAVPLIENTYSSGWVTTFSVQSVDGTPATLQMTYSGNMAANCNPCNYTMTSASHTFNQVTDGHVPTGFLGGVTITSNKDIVVIGDQNLTGGAGDTSAGFPGFGQ